MSGALRRQPSITASFKKSGSPMRSSAADLAISAKRSSSRGSKGASNVLQDGPEEVLAVANNGRRKSEISNSSLSNKVKKNVPKRKMNVDI